MGVFNIIFRTNGHGELLFLLACWIQHWISCYVSKYIKKSIENKKTTENVFKTENHPFLFTDNYYLGCYCRYTCCCVVTHVVVYFRENIHIMAACLIACGIRPEHTILFQQSKVICLILHYFITHIKIYSYPLLIQKTKSHTKWLHCINKFYVTCFYIFILCCGFLWTNVVFFCGNKILFNLMFLKIEIFLLSCD